MANQSKPSNFPNNPSRPEADASDKTANQNNLDYETGYKKPPKRNQFRKGQSGNPSGRPKGKRNFATIMNEVLHQPVTITDGGRQRSVPKFEAAVMQMSNKAASGDLGAMRLMIQLIPGIEQQMSQAGNAKLSHESDHMVLRELFKSLNDSTVQVIDHPQEIEINSIKSEKEN